ncbi:phosphodiester glycosidase family protein [Candidatus Daviesbacteria bacterium]|nr:phosphodiester glycosidase family protein [Candidatus Daviesbacteria bacterium]
MKPMKGFSNLPIIVAAALAILGAGWYFAYQQYKPNTAPPVTQEDPQARELSSQSASLKAKIASAAAIGVDVSQLTGVVAEIDELVIKRLYDDARGNIATISAEVDLLISQKAEEAAKAQSTVPQQAAAMTSGAYSRQSVQTQDGTFTVDMIAADLAAGARVITDVGSDGNCADGCPAFSLAEYVARHGGYAGINGTYFCPPDYAQCAGQTNSFTLMVYNSRTSTLINEDKKDWTNAGAFFLIDAGNGIHFYNPASGYDGASKKAGIAMRPALVQNRGYAVNEGAMEPKENTKANRPFIGNKGSTVYIGIVRSATVPEEARALASLGFDNAIHLDSGGSTALYHNGSYLYGPGRKLPSAVIFAR